MTTTRECHSGAETREGTIIIKLASNFQMDQLNTTLRGPRTTVWWVAGGHGRKHRDRINKDNHPGVS